MGLDKTCHNVRILCFRYRFSALLSRFCETLLLYWDLCQHYMARPTHMSSQAIHQRHTPVGWAVRNRHTCLWRSQQLQGRENKGLLYAHTDLTCACSCRLHNAVHTKEKYLWMDHKSHFCSTRKWERPTAELSVLIAVHKHTHTTQGIYRSLVSMSF